MHTIDIIAFVMFILWILGFIHIIPAIIIVALLLGVMRRRKSIGGKKGLFNHRIMDKKGAIK